jgi:hypothetical protein
MPEQTQSRLGPPRSGYASRACEAGPAHGVRTAPAFLRQLPPRVLPDSVRFSARRSSPLRPRGGSRRLDPPTGLRCVPLWSLKPAETGPEMLADSPAARKVWEASTSSAPAGRDARLSPWHGGPASRYDSRSKCSLRVWAAGLASRANHISDIVRLVADSLLNSSFRLRRGIELRTMS